MTPLEAAGLHRFYRRGSSEVAALLDVGLVCAPGETVAVTGPSGSGKSTLLALLAGLDDPDGGKVSICGEVLSHRSARDAAQLRARHIGVLTQASGLLDHLTVLQNVRLAAALRRRAGGVGGAGPEELLDSLGLSAVRRSRPTSLSGGETARAGLAVALAGNPDVLLADEPTAEISSAEERDVLDLLQQCRPEQGATVLITHSQVVASRADRVLHLRDGRLVSA
ncbi:MAG: putative transport system ATP-binding protein [Actinomycetota bacterium]|jgi:putative ABC transport system ATP-binding protein|nr:putative transport system ATP-binding protein [Actinomycetota bacterium]